MANLKESGIHTSIIGSFPIEDSIANRKRCIEDLIDIGIDFPTYPQLVDMGKLFLDDLADQNCGIIVEKGRYRLEGKEIREEVSPPRLEPFSWTLGYLKERGLKEKVKLKAAITGPFTLASYIETKSGTFPFNTALADLGLVKQLALILSKSCTAVSKEASMISIDEPILSVIVGARMPFGYSEDEIIESYNRLKRTSGDKFFGTHICGKLSPRLVGILLRTELDFLSHEFHDSPANIAMYSPKAIEESGKVLSIGCVSSKNPRIESPEEILRLIEKFDAYGEDLIFTPDCGFKNLIAEGSREEGYKVSIKKLRNMVEAVKEFEAKRPQRNDE